MTDWNDPPMPTIGGGSRPDGPDWAKILNLLTSISDAWTDYGSSLQWTGTGSNPAIGNGTITSFYKRSGKTVDYGGRITMGTTTTFGSGTWLVSLPISPLDNVNYAGAALTYDSSVTTARTPATAIMASLTSLSFYGVNGLITPTAPFTWASADVLSWGLRYQAA